MKTQYLVRYDSKARIAEGQAVLGSRTFPVELQASNPLDVVPGYLDLPSGILNYDEVETYLKILALFNDHILVPDGWFHNRGPLSEHLRHDFHAAQGYPQGHYGDWFASRTVPVSLRAGIIIPGLRGRRPTQKTQSILGFDLYEVWAGKVHDELGRVLGFGVGDIPERERMAILDPTDENVELLKLVTRSTTKFLDWASPSVPIDTVDFDTGPDVRRWDLHFATLVKEVVLDSPTRALGTEGIRHLLHQSVMPPSSLLGRVGDFHERLIDILQLGLQRPETFRRGSVERAVAEAMGVRRFTGYDQIIDEPDPSMESVVNPFAGMMSYTPVLLHLRPLLSRIVLDQVSLAQQAMFAEKFNASLGLGRRPVADLADRRLMLRCGLEITVPSFDRFTEPIIESELPLARLSASQILELRARNAAYFDAARRVVPSERFWQSNPELVAATRRYILDIVAAIPLGDAARTVIRGGRRSIVSAAVAGAFFAANPWFAGIELAPLGFSVVWWAQKGFKPLARLLTEGVDARIENWLHGYRQLGYADLLLRALDLTTALPESIRSVGR